MASRKKIKQPASVYVFQVFNYCFLTVLVLMCLYPMWYCLMASFSEPGKMMAHMGPLLTPLGFSVEAYKKVFLNPNIISGYKNTLFILVVGVFLNLIMTSLAAYVLSRFKFKTSKFWNVLFMAGLFINVSYIVVPIFLMLNNWDKTLRQLTGGTFFLNNLFVLALVYASTALPFTIYLLSGYFRSLAKDFEEAAYVDGASYFTTMVKIIFPMAKPSIVTVILFSFLSFWNEYIISMTLLTKPELKTLPVGLMNLMAAQKSAVQYGQMYAGLVIVMLPTLILYICVQKKLTQGMTLGGLKG